MTQIRGKATVQLNDIVMIEIQCLTCNHHQASLECDLGIIADDNVLLSKVACLNYEKMNIKHN